MISAGRPSPGIGVCEQRKRGTAAAAAAPVADDDDDVIADGCDVTGGERRGREAERDGVTSLDDFRSAAATLSYGKRATNGMLAR